MCLCLYMHQWIVSLYSISADTITSLPSSGVSHNDLVQLAEKKFSGLPSSPNALPTLAPCRYTGSEMRVRDDTMPFAHIAFAVEVHAMYRRDVLGGATRIVSWYLTFECRDEI